MSKSNKNGERKRDLLRRVRKQRLRNIAILPSLITLINGICGFAAICFTADGGDGDISVFKMDMPYFAVSGYLIFIAMIADMLDGRVARMSHSTSSFGGQLDSLCDMISFGVAPAFLIFKLLSIKLTDLVNPPVIFSGFVIRLIWLSAAVYLVCAAIRLARFNVENEEDETAHMNFIGLPTPAAAGVLASIVVFYEDVLLPDSRIYISSELLIIYSLPFITIGIAVLMISRFTFPHLLNKLLKGRKPLTHLAWALVIISLIMSSVQTALLVAFCGFTLYGFIKGMLNKMSRKKTVQPPVLNVTNPPDNSDELEDSEDETYED